MDNFFNIDHSEDNFLNLMAKYIPYEHRKFIYWMRYERLNMIKCLDILKKKKYNNTMNNLNDEILEIERKYNECVNKLRKFRMYHMKIVGDMIVTPSEKLQQKTKGTGGTSILPYLQSVLDRTHNKHTSKL